MKSNEFIDWISINPCKVEKGREIELEKIITQQTSLKEKLEYERELNATLEQEIEHTQENLNNAMLEVAKFEASSFAWKTMFKEQKKEIASLTKKLKAVESVWLTRIQELDNSAHNWIASLNRDKERLYRELKLMNKNLEEQKAKLSYAIMQRNGTQKDLAHAKEVLKDKAGILSWHITQRETYLRENEKLTKECDLLEAANFDYTTKANCSEQESYVLGIPI